MWEFIDEIDKFKYEQIIKFCDQFGPNKKFHDTHIIMLKSEIMMGLRIRMTKNIEEFDLYQCTNEVLSVLPLQGGPKEKELHENVHKIRNNYSFKLIFRRDINKSERFAGNKLN